MLAEIGAAAIPQLTVFNKIDLSGEAPRTATDAAGQPNRVWLSAQTGAGIGELQEALSTFFRRDRRLYRFRLPPESGRLRSILHERFEVQGESALEDGTMDMAVALNSAQYDWFTQQDGYDPGFLQDDGAVVLAPTGS